MKTEEKKIVVTISDAVQIGENAWKQVYTSRIFSISRPVKDMLTWAENEGFKNPKISDLQLSEYTGESI